MSRCIHIISHTEHSVGSNNNWYVSTNCTVQALTALGYTVVIHSPPTDMRSFVTAVWLLLKKIRPHDIVYIISTDIVGYDKFSLLKLFRPTVRIFWEIHAVEEELLWFTKGYRTVLEVQKNKLLRFFYSRFVSASFCLSKPLLEYSKTILKIKNSFLISSVVNDTIFGKPSKNIQPRDTFIFSPFKAKKSFIVYWAGGEMYPWQGLDVIERVAKAVYELDRQIIFVIVGSNMWHTFTFIKNIVFYSRTTFENNMKMASLSNVCLALYTENCKRVTGYDFYYSPRKIIEFMALGKPVIATKTPEIEHIVKHNSEGYIVNNDPKKIATLILKLKRDSDLALTIGAAAKRKILHEYRIRNLTDAYERYFKQMELCIKNAK